ncbi:MAG TPA: hypothetical protein VF682_13485 [Pseudomonas sp.]|jgi:uncharacterized delta-60 repeat protein
MDTSLTSAPRLNGGRDLDFGEDGRFSFTETEYGFTVAPVGRVTAARDGSIFLAAPKITWNEFPPDAYMFLRIKEDGTPDRDFGVNGVASGHFGNGLSSLGGSVTVTHDGKLLLSGYYLEGPFTPVKPGLARHLSTGELDKSFGNQGTISLYFPLHKTDTTPTTPSPEGGPSDPPSHFYSFSVTPLQNGKIIFSGVIEPDRDSPRFNYSILGRLNPDGSLDTSFANQGYLSLPGTENISDSHIVQPDQKILVCGQFVKNSTTTAYISRYLENGESDLEFGAGGTVYIPDVLGDGFVATMALGEKGNIMLGANKHIDDGGAPLNGVLMSFTSDGNRDLQFNNGNPVDIKLGTDLFRCTLKDTLLDGDGVIILGEMGNMALARYLLDGSADVNFGDRAGWWQYLATDVFNLDRQADGKFLAAGFNKEFRFVARFLNR